MRLGLIGLGRIGAFHAGILTEIPAVDSLVVTDLVPERTAAVVARHGDRGVEGVGSLPALIGAGVDGVVIAAGTDAHTALVLACVEAGLPTLCEKPVAPSGAEEGVERVDALHAVAAEPLDDGLGPLRDEVGDHQRVDRGYLGEDAGVERADPAEPDQSEPHACLLFMVAPSGRGSRRGRRRRWACVPVGRGARPGHSAQAL